MLKNALDYRTLLAIVLAVGVCRAGEVFGAENGAANASDAAQVRPAGRASEKPLAAAVDAPHELSMRALPAYRIEPPDILSIEMLQMVPLPPYHVHIFDVLQIRVAGTLLDQPIDGFFLVEADGIVTLGPSYGRVQVAGMTVEKAADAIRRKLTEVLQKPAVSVQLARDAGIAPVTGEYLVGPDGTINLRNTACCQ